MKITRRQLKQLIKEELNMLESNSGSDYDEKLDPDGNGALDADELRDIADDLETEDQDPPKSFSVSYRSSGYQGRRIISRDRAWLEFVPKGNPSQTPEDMFREVTLLKNWDPEIQRALDASDHDLAPGDLDQYDVYSVYATTTG